MIIESNEKVIEGMTVIKEDSDVESREEVVIISLSIEFELVGTSEVITRLLISLALRTRVVEGELLCERLERERE